MVESLQKGKRKATSSVLRRPAKKPKPKNAKKRARNQDLSKRSLKEATIIKAERKADKKADEWDNDAFEFSAANSAYHTGFAADRNAKNRVVKVGEAKYKLIEDLGHHDPDLKGRQWIRDTDNNEVIGLHTGFGTAPKYMDSVRTHTYDSRQRELYPWSPAVLAQSKYAKYKHRPNVGAAPRPSTDKRLDLFLIKKTYEVDQSKQVRRQDALTIYLSGLDAEGHTVTLAVRGFKPYCLFRIPEAWKRACRTNPALTPEVLIADLRTKLTRQLRMKLKHSAKLRQTLDGLLGYSDDMMTVEPVLDAEFIRKAKDLSGCWGYNATEDFVKLTVLHPALIPEVRRLLENPLGGMVAGYRDTRTKVWPWYYDRQSDRDCNNRRLVAPEGGTFVVYEANVEFGQRFIIDRGLTASKWLCADASHYYRVPDARRKTITDFEYECRWSSVRPANDKDLDPRPIALREAADSDDGLLTGVYPRFVVAAFDDEMEPDAKGAFPNAVNERIIQRGLHVYSPVSGRHDRYLFCVGDVRPDAINDPETALGKVFSFDTEVEMLEAYCEFLQVIQPQFYMGWNSNGFDLPYFFNRCRVLGVACASNLGTMPHRRVYWTARKNKGLSKTCFSMAGVITYDLMLHIRTMASDFKSNGLSYACKKLLQIDKLEFSYGKIRDYQKTAIGRTYLGAYCARDVEVLVKMLDKMSCIMVLVEESRKTNTLIQDLLDRGSQHKVFNAVLTQAKLCADKLGPVTKAFYPTLEPLPATGKYKGATVLEPPKRWLYQTTTLTLDLASLYPSIVMEVNLCPSTLISEDHIVRNSLVEGRDYTREPVFIADDKTCEIEILDNKHMPAFATAEYQQGVVPLLENKLFWGRKATKRLMAAAKAALKKAKDSGTATAKEIGDLEFKVKLYDADQLAQKIVMNSIYGAQGSVSSQIRCMEAARRITTEGRLIIARGKRWTRKFVNQAHGYPFRMESIYGDTDSIFNEAIFDERPAYDPKLGKMVMRKVPLAVQASCVLQWGTYIEDELNRYTKEVDGYKNGKIVWEFEKIYFRLLMTGKKKMYAGYLYNPFTNDEYVDTKGLKMVRRDCPEFLRNAQERIVDALVKWGDVPRCLDIARDAAIALKTHKVPYRDIKQSSSLSKYPEEYGALVPHVAVALKIQERTGERVTPGTRVNYIMCKSEYGKKAQVKRANGKTGDVTKSMVAEDALYAIRNGLEYDENHYIETVLMPNVLMLLRYAVPGGEPAVRKYIYSAPEMRRVAPDAAHGWAHLDALKKNLSALQCDGAGGVGVGVGMNGGGGAEEDAKRRSEKRLLAKNAVDKKLRGTLDHMMVRVSGTKCGNCKSPVTRRDYTAMGCSNAEFRDAQAGSAITAFCKRCIEDQQGAIVYFKHIQKNVNVMEAGYRSKTDIYKTCSDCIERSGITNASEIAAATETCECTDCDNFWRRIETNSMLAKTSQKIARIPQACRERLGMASEDVIMAF